MCSSLKTEGSSGAFAKSLKEKLWADYKGRKIKLLVPDDPYAGGCKGTAGPGHVQNCYHAEKRYARMLLDWPLVKYGGGVNISYEVVSDTVAMYELTRGEAVDNTTTYVYVGAMNEADIDLVKMIRSRGCTVLVVHESMCGGCDGVRGGCVAKYGAPLGCPYLNEDVHDLTNHSTVTDRLYFVPFGSELASYSFQLFSSSAFQMMKTQAPSMVVDASSEWRGSLSAAKFVQIVQRDLPGISLVVIGGKGLNITNHSSTTKHFAEGISNEQLERVVSKAWYYATGIPDAYGLGSSDAAMAGAILVDVGGNAKAAVRPETTVTICGQNAPTSQGRCSPEAKAHFTSDAQEVVAKLRDVEGRWRKADLAHATAAWGQSFHGYDYVGMGLLCSIRADEFADHRDWTADQFQPPDPEDADSFLPVPEPQPLSSNSSQPLSSSEEWWCFGADTSLACRLRQTADLWSSTIGRLGQPAEVEARAAFEACFRGGSGDAELVPLTRLRSGDYVITLDPAGEPVLDHIVLNQHLGSSQWAKLLRLETAEGAAITVTPEHVILLDGIFVAAAEAQLGASLSAGSIVRITEAAGRIINPVTASGTILVADTAADGMPNLASTHPRWIAPFMLAAPTFPFVTTHLLSQLAPETLQASYSTIEHVIAAALPLPVRASATVPSAFFAFGVLVVDAIFALGVLVASLVMAVQKVAIPLGIAGVALVAARSQDRLYPRASDREKELR